MVLVEKPDLNNPRHTNHRDPDEIDDKDDMSPLYIIIMIPNIITSFSRAYHRNDNDYSFAVLTLIVFFCSILFECLPRYLSIPKDEKSSRKFLLKLSIWLMYSGMSAGLAYLFAHVVSLQIMVALYAAVFMGSVYSLYVFIVVDLINDWKVRSSGEDEIGILENDQTSDAGKFNHPDSVLETV